jgi:hypothetical protein
MKPGELQSQGAEMNVSVLFSDLLRHSQIYTLEVIRKDEEAGLGVVLLPVTPATVEVEAGCLESKASKTMETLSQKQNENKRTEDVTQVVRVYV